MGDLTMQHFLVTYVAEGPSARNTLLAEGHHPKVINAKAEKAFRKGYYEYGFVADRGWVTDKGFDYTLGETDE